ncbi:Hypothetical protein EMIHUDRAFT_445137, partial [Emiliania huxleyi CCMP1516]|uniref:Uncharacterized protein n=2 Tax=Emiliania huxleyi TaxID=2903 RepID=A0A0D3J4W6_EMIH1
TRLHKGWCGERRLCTGSEHTHVAPTPAARTPSLASQPLPGLDRRRKPAIASQRSAAIFSRRAAATEARRRGAASSGQLAARAAGRPRANGARGADRAPPPRRHVRRVLVLRLARRLQGGAECRLCEPREQPRWRGIARRLPRWAGRRLDLGPARGRLCHRPTARCKPAREHVRCAVRATTQPRARGARERGGGPCLGAVAVTRLLRSVFRRLRRPGRAAHRNDSGALPRAARRRRGARPRRRRRLHPHARRAGRRLARRQGGGGAARADRRGRCRRVQQPVARGRRPREVGLAANGEGARGDDHRVDRGGPAAGGTGKVS